MSQTDTAAQAAQMQKMQTLQQILGLLKGNASPTQNLGFNYKGATTLNSYVQDTTAKLVSSFVPAPFGPLLAPFIGDIVGSLLPSSSSALSWRGSGYMNPYGMSAAGFAQSQSFVQYNKTLSSDASTAFNDALKKVGGNRTGDPLDGYLQFFGIDKQQRSASAGAARDAYAVLANRYSDIWSNSGKDDRRKQAAEGIATAVTQAMTGRYYGGFKGPQVGLLAQQMASRGGFDDIIQSNTVQDRADKIKSRIQQMSRALQPLKDIFGTDIKSLLSGLQSLYGTGVSAMGTQQVSRIASNVRNTLYATGSNLQQLAKAKEAAAQYRKTINPQSSGNIVFNDINTAARYVSSTANARQSAFMSTNEYRTSTMRDLVQSANSRYADNVNKAYGHWAASQAAKGADTSIQAFQKAVAAARGRGMSYDQAYLELAGKKSSVHQLQKSSWSDYAQRSGLGARHAADANMTNRIQNVLTQNTMWMNQADAAAVTNAYNKLVGSDPDKVLSQIYGLNGDRQSFTDYLNSKKITDADTQAALYRIMTDTRGGSSIAAMGNAAYTRRRALQKSAKLQELSDKYAKAQAKLDVSASGQAGLWALLQHGDLRGDDAKLLLTMTLGDVDVDKYVEITKNQGGDVAGLNFKGELSYLNKLSNKDKVKALRSMEKWMPKVTTNGKIVADKLEQFFTGKASIDQLLQKQGLATDVETQKAVEKIYKKAETARTAPTAPGKKSPDYGDIYEGATKKARKLVTQIGALQRMSKLSDTGIAADDIKEFKRQLRGDTDLDDVTLTGDKDGSRADKIRDYIKAGGRQLSLVQSLLRQVCGFLKRLVGGKG